MKKHPLNKRIRSSAPTETELQDRMRGLGIVRLCVWAVNIDMTGRVQEAK